MSELKEHLFVPYSELQEGAELTDDFTIAKSYYLKSEVDKVIAHHKHKRCLAMAMWCSAELGMLVSTWESKIKHYKKWQKRWCEIAEKFKEAK